MLQMLLLFIGLVLSLSAFSFGGIPATPDPTISPGALCSPHDPDFDSIRNRGGIGEHAHCERNVSEKLRREVFKLYGIPEQEQGKYNIDHIIALGLGGSNSLYNLWPEYWCTKTTREKLEHRIHLQLLKNRISLREAVGMALEVKFNPQLSYGDCSF